MSILLADLLERISPDVQSRVERICSQAHRQVRDALRFETRLAMQFGQEAQAARGARVPVRVDVAYPESLVEVELPDDFHLVMQLARYRPSLAAVAKAAPRLVELRNWFGNTPPLGHEVGSPEITAVGEWSDRWVRLLAKSDPLQPILSVSADVLGHYVFGPSRGPNSPNSGEVKVYWAVLGLVADIVGCAVEDLALVVLTHELAHAYTQLGADIDGHRWDPGNYSSTDLFVVEGLAQYYTHRVLARLEGSFEGAQKVFEVVSASQPEEYSVHEFWVAKYSPEAVRRATIEIRRSGGTTYGEFFRRLNAAQKSLVE